jgi:PAS domain S-box-containing protein
MTEKKEAGKERHASFKRAGLSWLALVLSMLMALGVWLWADAQAERQLHEAFLRRTGDIRVALRSSIADYQNLLRAASATFAASDQVRREEWQRLARTLDLAGNYPAVVGLAFARSFEDAERDAVVGAMRAGGLPEFDIRPPGRRERYVVNVYAEPFEGGNVKAIGFDMWQDATRRATMEESLRNGEPTMSPKVTLAIDAASQPVPAFIMYMPALDREGKLLGFVLTPVRMPTLISKLNILSARGVAFAIYDGREGDAAALLHESGHGLGKHGHRWSHTEVVEVAGRTWRVEFFSEASLESLAGYRDPLWLLVLGMIISLLLFLLVRSLVSARSRAEDELRIWGSAFQNAAFGLAIADAGSKTFLAANPTFAAERGYQPGELEGKPLTSVYPADQREAAAQRFRKLEKRPHIVFEAEHVRKDGERFPVQMDVTVIRDTAGRPQKYVAYSMDITDRKRIEAEVAAYRDHLEALVRARTEELSVAKEAAEAANVAKSTFLANMSHEIRTPLNAITGMAHLIRKAGLSPEQGERLDKLEAAGAHLLEIIESILDLSKIEAGKFGLVESPLQVDQLLERVASMLHDRAAAKGLTLTAESSALPTLLGDVTRLQQALVNYAGNAVKFTERGRIVLRALPVDEFDDAVLVRFEVVDNGIGIAPENLARLFSPFEQVDNSATREFGGTGLGLAITRKLAQLMGGEAGAESVPEQGSTFWFTARLARVRSATAEAADPATVEARLRAAHAGARILVAEDDPINRELAMVLLADAGLVVDLAEDGEQAVALAQANPYDAILMDMQMPNLDGIEAAQRIRRIAGHVRTPILATTANAFVSDRERCLAAGMDDFITKPIRPELLYGALLKWLSRPAA